MWQRRTGWIQSLTPLAIYWNEWSLLMSTDEACHVHPTLLATSLREIENTHRGGGQACWGLLFEFRLAPRAGPGPPT